MGVGVVDLKKVILGLDFFESGRRCSKKSKKYAQKFKKVSSRENLKNRNLKKFWCDQEKVQLIKNYNLEKCLDREKTSNRYQKSDPEISKKSIDLKSEVDEIENIDL